MTLASTKSAHAGKSMVNAAKWQVASNLVSLMVGLLQLFLLARVFDPSDFGLIAILMVIISISQAFSDMGMSNYLVYRQKISSVLNSTIFWNSLLVGFALCGIIIISAPFVASFYEQKELSVLIQTCSLNFIIVAFGSQLQSRFLLEFKLKQLALFEMMAKPLGLIVAISCAFNGVGVISVVYGLLAASSLKSMLLWSCSGRLWKPKFEFCLEEAKLGWSYGLYQVGGKFLNQLRGNVDTMLLGLLLSVGDLGYYSMAKELVTKPAAFVSPIIQRLFLPLFASKQNALQLLNKSVYSSHYYVILLVTAIYMPVIILAQILVNWFYGAEHIFVAQLVVPLGLFWMLRTLGGALVPALTQGLGFTKREFYWNLIMFLITPPVIWFFAQKGPISLAWGLFAMQLTLFPVVFKYFHNSLANLSLLQFTVPILKTVMSSLFSLSIFYWFFDAVIPEKLYFIKLVVISISSSLVYYLLTYYWQRNENILVSPNKILHTVTHKLRLHSFGR